MYFFYLNMKNTIDILTFCKNCLSEKNLVLGLSKNLQTNQNSGFFKLQYILKELRYEAEFLYVVRHPLKQQVHSFVSSGRGQVCPDMPKVLPNKINLLVYSLFFTTTPTRSKTYMLAPSDTRHKWNVHKTSSERRMYIQFTS